MAIIYDVLELDVVGYAEVLQAGRFPRKVAPIFKNRGSGTYIFPPHLIDYDKVRNGTEGSQDDWNSLVLQGQGTSIDAISAIPNAILWIDENLRPHYENARDAIGKLKSLARTKYREAKDHFEKGRYQEAKQAARYAFASDETQWLPLALQAAAGAKMNDNVSDGILKKIAAKLVDEDEFETRKQAFIDECHTTTLSIGYVNPISLRVQDVENAAPIRLLVAGTDLPVNTNGYPIQRFFRQMDLRADTTLIAPQIIREEYELTTDVFSPLRREFNQAVAALAKDFGIPILSRKSGILENRKRHG